MKQETKRCIMFAEYILSTEKTLRETAKYFGYSKSTVHNDVSKKLQKENNVLYEKVKIILDKHFAEKHLRGGESTRKKYLINAI